jgi:hypothetical protein
VDDLHVDSELLAVVVEDKDAEAATTGLKGARETAREVGLVNDGETLLDVTGLSHGNDVAALEVQDTVLLEDRAEHGLDDDAGGRVGDERGLLVQLLGEEVNTEVAVLAGGRGGGDADDLAGTALEDQEVTKTDVVARDGDGVGDIGVAGVTGTGTRSRSRSGVIVDVHVDVVVVLMACGVSNAVSQLVDSLAEGVVVTVLVVVTHSGFLVGYGVANWFDSFLGDLYVLLVGRSGWNLVVNGEFVDVNFVVTEARSGRSVYGNVVRSVVRRLEAFTVLAFSNVNRASEGFGDVNVDVDVSVCVFGARLNRTARLVNVMLVMDTGTVVTFFFACKTDLFFKALLCTRRECGVDRD